MQKLLRALSFLGLGALSCATQSQTAPTADATSVTKPSVFVDTYQQGCVDAVADARARLTALEAVPVPHTVDSVLKPLNELWRTVDRALNHAGLYRSVHPEAKVRTAAEECEQKMSTLVTDLGLSRPLYEAVQHVEADKADVLTTRYLKNLLRDFRRAGVDKNEDVRARVRTIKDELVKVGQAFDQNIREDVRRMRLGSVDELAGLPQDYIDGHKPEADGAIVISTDYPDYLPYMTYAKSDARKLELYKLFRQRGNPKNDGVLNDLLKKRYELAQLLGYKTWADYITEDKMIKTAANASEFIEKVTKVSKVRADGDYAVLLKRLKKDLPKAQSVGDWQKTYLEELVKKEDYAFDSQRVRQFLPYSRVKDGLFEITSQMFGVRYQKVDVPVWHESVEAYEMRRGDELIGRFYLDMHPRADKYKHAAAFPMVTGVAGQQVPEATLVCNFPGGTDPWDLLEHDQVETFFHEFGHLLHHLFGGQQPWLGVSGFNTEWDFVEAPSQMLEEWVWDPETLQRFAKDKEGNTIPDDLVASMRRARDFGKGLWVRHQMFYAAISLNFYNQPNGFDTNKLVRKLQEQYSPFPYVDDTYFQYSFGHLDGYSAIYYTYMWSLVIAKDLFSVFQKQGLLNPEVAERYRKFVLAPGGSQDAADLVKGFLGRAYSFDAFVSWLSSG